VHYDFSLECSEAKVKLPKIKNQSSLKIFEINEVKYSNVVAF